MIPYIMLIIMFNFIVHDTLAWPLNEQPIDLNTAQKRPDHCISQLNTTSPSLIRVIATQTRCFRVYDEENCIGRHIKFSPVSTQILRLRDSTPETRRSGIQQLLNFNLRPKSFQPCETKVENHVMAPTPITSVLSQCLTESMIQVETKIAFFTNPTITEFPLSNKCNDISKYSRSYQSGASSSIKLKNDGHKKDHCIEMYSQFNCFGKKVQMVIPPESFNKDTNMLTLWEYSYIHKVDIDAKSIRKCSQCLPKEKIQFPEMDNLDSYQESDEMTPPPQSKPVDVAMSIYGCRTISVYLKNNLTGDDGISTPNQNCYRSQDCYIVFRTPDCSGNPVTEYEFKNTLPKTVNQLRNWSLSRCCASYKNKNQLKQELHIDGIPVIRELTLTETLEPFKKEKPASTWQISKLEIAILSISGSLALIMIIIVIILSFLLYNRKKRLAAARRIIARARLQQQRALTIHQAGSVVGNHYTKPVSSLDTLCYSFTTKGYTVARASIDIGNIRDSTASIIGVGEHSVVFKGTLESDQKIKETVAVKTIKSGQATVKSIKRALQECSIIIEVGKHERVVKLLGVCIENVNRGEVYMIYKYYSKGSLKSYLTQNRNNFVNLVINGDTIDDTLVANFAKSAKADQTIEEVPEEATAKFDTYQLLKWCFEIADVMEFLSSRNIVHVSLSARNVMLDSNLACKLSDFQFAKTPNSSSVRNSEIGNAYRDRTIPWRSLAIESILEESFTTSSDVWTFGIFMWELFSLGGVPYPEYNYGTEFTMSIKHGYRLLKPKYSTTECFELMIMCWYDSPERRPAFPKLKSKLRGMLPEALRLNLYPE